MAIIKLVLAFFLSIGQLISPYFAILGAHGVDGLYDDWSYNDCYTKGYAFNLEKDPDKDFVVLNLTDIQLSGDDVYGEIGQTAEATIKKLVEETKPDLITVTGDNGSSKMAYIRMIEVLDSFGIPWAPVMGNHDGDNGKKVAEAWCGCSFLAAKNCLFKFGPKGMGVGNYIINITENGEIIHTLYMMDTHSYVVHEDGSESYDHLWDNQLTWYEWAVKGNRRITGKDVRSTIFFHIPCIQYRDAWNAAYVAETDSFRPEYPGSFGKFHDSDVCAPVEDSGFFELVKSLGSTKDIISGHDHTNSFSIEYEGVRLSYGLKTGGGCYWEEDMSGGSTLTIDSTGSTVFAHHYIDPSALK